MGIYDTKSIRDRLQGDSYVGRGIVVGKTADASKAAIAYFIMGRSANSRNRVFALRGDDVYTEPFDPSKLEDPSLIIYAAVRTLGNQLIVTNGDQTDTIAQHLRAGKSFEQALQTRAFEPDAPNFTPRISALLRFENGDFSYKLSILKSIDAEGSDCARYTFSYPPKPGLGHFLHTYVRDGSPIPSFQGEPERTEIPNSIDDFTREIWENLDESNKISLYTRYIDLKTGGMEYRLINKNSERSLP